MNAIPKVVVITGASQGIGAELVRAFLGRGYRVVANSRSIRPEDSSEVLAVAEILACSNALWDNARGNRWMKRDCGQQTSSLQRMR